MEEANAWWVKEKGGLKTGLDKGGEEEDMDVDEEVGSEDEVVRVNGGSDNENHIDTAQQPQESTSTMETDLRRGSASSTSTTASSSPPSEPDTTTPPPPPVPLACDADLGLKRYDPVRSVWV